MQLELRFHECASFVTLTYSPENLPDDGSVQVEHLQLFLKRLRKALEPRRIRFYAVGEYGERTMRPHYHLILYGVPMTEGKLLSATWGLGLVHVGEVTPHSIQYTAGYVTKKMTKAGDPRLGGRKPEFATMSRKPGLGVGAVDLLARSLMTETGSAGLQALGDVPHTVRLEGKEMPLGGVFIGKLREAVGADSPRAPARRKAEWVQKMLTMQEGQSLASLKAGGVTDWARSDRAIHRLIKANNRRKL